jgi:hypothetical protein
MSDKQTTQPIQLSWRVLCLICAAWLAAGGNRFAWRTRIEPLPVIKETTIWLRIALCQSSRVTVEDA